MNNYLSRWPWREPVGTINSRPASIGPTGKAYLRAVIMDVAARHRVDPELLTGPKRTKELTLARREAWATIHGTGRFSTPQIGRFFNRDHSTIVCGLAKYRALAQQEAA